MPKTVTIELESIDVLQIIDALNARAQSWERTASLLDGAMDNGEFDSDDFFVPEECHNSTEASDVAQHFRDIALKIESQLANSG